MNDQKRKDYKGQVEFLIEALEAFQLLARLEGILPALEPSHALAHIAKLAPTKPRDDIMIVNLCGRGDKDIFTVADAIGAKI